MSGAARWGDSSDEEDFVPVIHGDAAVSTQQMMDPIPSEENIAVAAKSFVAEEDDKEREGDAAYEVYESEEEEEEEKAEEEDEEGRQRRLEAARQEAEQKKVAQK